MEKGYDSDYPSASEPSSSQLPLHSPFKGKILRKTKGSINGHPFYNQFGQKITSVSKSTVELTDGKIIRKSDIAIPKSKSSTIRSFRGNISFPSLTNPDFQVGSRRTSKPKPQQTRKIGPKTRRQIELATPYNTRTRETKKSEILQVQTNPK